MSTATNTFDPRQARRVQAGAELDYVPEGAVPAGTVVVIGDDLGVPDIDLWPQQLGALADQGVFDVVKDGNAVSDRDLVYWHAAGNPVGGTAGSGAANNTPGGGILFGKCVQAALATDALVRVKKLNVASVTNTVTTLLANQIADPGNAGAIPVDQSGQVAITTATVGGETRTLAAPTAAGQLLSLTLSVLDGTCVITAACRLNHAGNTIITMAAAGECVLLEAVTVGAALVWSVVRADGAVLSSP
jgi:predicted RecA/RadA family phage recombinase